MEQNRGKILLTNIQRFSLHDGPGIRTTVFLKGCSLRCPWCSNPENFLPIPQNYVKNGKIGTYGFYLSADELYTEIIKDKSFYIGDINDFSITQLNQLEHLPGGVTFSGGECLLQARQLLPLLKRLNKEHIHTAIETCLFVPKSFLEIAIKYIDFFYVDVKILEMKSCQYYLHGKLNLYLNNLDILFHTKKPIVLRVPVIGEYTDSIENRKKIIELIDRYVKKESANLLKIELIKEHNLGISKYQSLNACNEGYEIPKYKGVSDELMKQYKQEIIDRVGKSVFVDICII